MHEEVFEYRFGTGFNLVGSIGGGAMAAWISWMALTNDAGLRLNGIPFGETGATMIYGAVALVAAWVAAKFVRGLLRGKGAKVPVVLGAHGIEAPTAPGSNKMVRLDYAGITDIKVQNAASKRFLHIKHRAGKLSISGGALQRRETFERLVQSLAQRTRIAHGA